MRRRYYRSCRYMRPRATRRLIRPRATRCLIRLPKRDSLTYDTLARNLIYTPVWSEAEASLTAAPISSAAPTSSGLAALTGLAGALSRLHATCGRGD